MLHHPSDKILEGEIGRVPLDSEINLHLVGVAREIICSHCFRVVKAKVFEMHQETPFGKVLAYIYKGPTRENPFLCAECYEEEKKTTLSEPTA